MALDLPAVARDELSRWAGELLGARPELRAVAPASLHVTLAFLGWQDEEALPEIASAALTPASVVAAPRLSFGPVRAVPPRRPRLFALDLGDAGGRAAELQRRVSDELEAGGWYIPERRPFWPHVTLARVRRGERRVAPLAGPPPALSFEARELTLYRSILRREGALYEPLGRAELA